jgi:hypothetical protein
VGERDASREVRFVRLVVEDHLARVLLGVLGSRVLGLELVHAEPRPGVEVRRRLPPRRDVDEDEGVRLDPLQAQVGVGPGGEPLVEERSDLGVIDPGHDLHRGDHPGVRVLHELRGPLDRLAELRDGERDEPGEIPLREPVRGDVGAELAPLGLGVEGGEDRRIAAAGAEREEALLERREERLVGGGVAARLEVEEGEVGAEGPQRPDVREAAPGEERGVAPVAQERADALRDLRRRLVEGPLVGLEVHPGEDEAPLAAPAPPRALDVVPDEPGDDLALAPLPRIRDEPREVLVRDDADLVRVVERRRPGDHLLEADRGERVRLRRVPAAEARVRGEELQPLVGDDGRRRATGPRRERETKGDECAAGRLHARPYIPMGSGMQKSSNTDFFGTNCAWSWLHSSISVNRRRKIPRPTPWSAVGGAPAAAPAVPVSAGFGSAKSFVMHLVIEGEPE